MNFSPMMNALAMPSGSRLHRIVDADAPLAAVAQQRLEARHFRLGGDDEDVANSGQHQRGQRIIDHRLIVDRQQLLGADDRQRPQPRSGAAGENDAFSVTYSCVPIGR